VGTVNARYEDGVLKPEGRLDLQPGERVRLVVLRRSDPSRWDRKRLASELVEDRTLAATGMDEWGDALEAEDRR
jgi:predicted DNA-binding antitoxin AbrB/MazE fold protein